MLITPTKKIFIEMINDEWVTREHIESGNVKIELVLMYQYGVNIIMNNKINWHQDRYTKVTLHDQINTRKHEISLFDSSQQHDWYDEEIIVVHKQQLAILQGLKTLLLIQYN